jgi:phage-related protein
LLLGDLKKLIDGVKNGMKNGIDKVVKPLVAKARDFILNTVMKPAISALGGILSKEIDKVVERVAANILGRTEGVRGQLDKLGGIIEAVASGEQGINDKLAGFNMSIDTLGKDVVNFAVDYGLGWLRGKAVTFVMGKIQKLMDKVWSWAYKGVSIARNAVQGAVGTIPFVGGVLAATLGLLIDEGWNLLKGKVDEFIETAVNNLADSAMGAAKNMLSGLTGKAGGALQGLVNALRGPLQTISNKVKERVMPILEKYRAVVSRLQKLAAK